MLSELQELRAIKRNIEESLQAMTDSDRQRAAQMKRFDDLRKTELARAKKDSDIEIRKLVSHVIVSHVVVRHVVVLSLDLENLPCKNQTISGIRFTKVVYRAIVEKLSCKHALYASN